MEILLNKFRRDPNVMVSSVYSGVAPGGRTVTTVVKLSADRNHTETTSVYGESLPRGVGGRIGVLVLGGLVTTLDEMEYIIAAKQDKRFVPRRTTGEIAGMCRLLAERRNEQIRAARKQAQGNPSRTSKKRTVRLHLPVGFRYVNTGAPGLQVAVRG